MNPECKIPEAGARVRTYVLVRNLRPLTSATTIKLRSLLKDELCTMAENWLSMPP